VSKPEENTGKATLLEQPRYLGDGVYVNLGADGMVRIMTGSHYAEPAVFLEPGVCAKMHGYLAEVIEEYRSRGVHIGA